MTVGLAHWREDRDALFPCVTSLPDYYEETCDGATKYRFTVVALYDQNRFAQKVVEVSL